MSATPPTNTLYIVTGYWNDDHRNSFDGYYMYDGSEDDCPVPDDEIFYYGHHTEDGLEFTITSYYASGEPETYTLQMKYYLRSNSRIYKVRNREFLYKYKI